MHNRGLLRFAGQHHFHLPLRDQAIGDLRKPVEAVFHDLDKNVPLYAVQTMDTLMSTSVARQRTATVIFGIFGAIAVALASIGLYGVIAHGVAERTREIGVRIALGASRARVMRLFLGQGVVMTTAGVALGVAGAIGLSRFMRELLFEVRPTDPRTFWVVSVTLFAVGLAACYLPARRATRVDPTVALRD